MAHGTVQVERSNGTVELVNKNVLRFSVDEMYSIYKKHCEQHSHLPISHKNYSDLCGVVGPGRESLLAAVDTVYCTLGLNNFESIREFIKLVTIGRDNIKSFLMDMTNDLETHINKSLSQELSETSHCKWHNFPHLFDDEHQPKQATTSSNSDCLDEDRTHCSMRDILFAQIDRAIEAAQHSHSPQQVEGPVAQLHDEPHSDDPNSKASLLEWSMRLHINE